MQTENATNNNEGVMEHVMNGKIYAKMKSGNIWALLISVILFGAMCFKGELYTYLWGETSSYKVLGILIPVTMLLPVISKILLTTSDFENVKSWIFALQVLASICALVGYLIIRANTGGHQTESEFYGRRFLSIWFSADVIITFLMYRVMREAKLYLSENEAQ